MKNAKRINEYFAQNPEKLNQMLEGLDRYSSIKKEDIPDFDEIYGSVIKEYKEKASNREKKPLFLRKALYIPVGACLVIGIFLVTPTGQAFAQNIFHTIVKWFDTGVNIHHGISENATDNEQMNVAYYENVESVREAIKKEIAWNSKENILNDIEVKTDISETRIVTTYVTSVNSSVIITQTIFEGVTEWDTNISSLNATPVDITMPNGSHFIGYMSDGYCYVINYYNNMSIEVFSEDSDPDTFIEFIKDIRID